MIFRKPCDAGVFADMNRLALPLFLAASAIGAWAAQSGSSNPQASSTAIQGGDQFLDGIGETALIVRYALNGNLEDSSRNQRHGTMRGPGGVFVEDGPRKAGEIRVIWPSPIGLRRWNRRG